MTDEYLYLWYGMISRLDHMTKMRLVARYGGLWGLWRVSEDTLRSELTAKQADCIVEYRSEKKVHEYACRLRDKKVSYIYPGHECYPGRLYDIPDPPMLLFAKGNVELLGSAIPSVAVVGARKASLYGRDVAYRLSGELAGYGVEIVSGMALGVDGAAHRAAISGGGVSVAVMGSGINVPYPRENYNIYHDIQANGVVISESGLDVKPEAFRFPYRNRIISGMSDGVLVIEAREKSGSLITADQALEQGRSVYAVPGRITDECSAGCNNLIKQGAVCVTCTEDIIAELGLTKRQRAHETATSDEEDAMFNKNLLAPAEKKVYSCVRLESRHVDDICFESGVTVSEAAQILCELERKKLVKQLVRNYYVKV